MELNKEFQHYADHDMYLKISMLDFQQSFRLSRFSRALAAISGYFEPEHFRTKSENLGQKHLVERLPRRNQ